MCFVGCFFVVLHAANKYRQTILCSVSYSESVKVTQNVTMSWVSILIVSQINYHL